jgi:hypothetical protein
MTDNPRYPHRRTPEVRNALHPWYRCTRCGRLRGSFGKPRTAPREVAVSDGKTLAIVAHVPDCRCWDCHIGRESLVG